MAFGGSWSLNGCPAFLWEPIMGEIWHVRLLAWRPGFRAASTRLSQQLCQLAKGSALLGFRDTADIEDLDLVRGVAFDCIPATRRQILDALIDQQDLKRLRLPPPTLTYALEDLECVRLVNGRMLAEDAVQLLSRAGLGE
jgi:hypothetical protein